MKDAKSTETGVTLFAIKKKEGGDFQDFEHSKQKNNTQTVFRSCKRLLYPDKKRQKFKVPVKIAAFSASTHELSPLLAHFYLKKQLHHLSSVFQHCA